VGILVVAGGNPVVWEDTPVAVGDNLVVGDTSVVVGDKKQQFAALHRLYHLDPAPGSQDIAGEPDWNFPPRE